MLDGRLERVERARRVSLLHMHTSEFHPTLCESRNERGRFDEIFLCASGVTTEESASMLEGRLSSRRIRLLHVLERPAEVISLCLPDIPARFLILQALINKRKRVNVIRCFERSERFQ
jgi:hypothetical protein